MTKRRRRSGGKVVPLPCTQGGPHDFADTWYVNPDGYVTERSTCRYCLLTLSGEVPGLRKPKTTA